jgi:DNA-directed RNA polymerase specialized sigma24 family protein
MSRRGHVVTIRGVTYRSLQEIAAAFGIPVQTVRGRWGRGDRDERLVRAINMAHSRKGRW